MRWSGISALLVIAALFLVSAYLFTDDWIESKLEYHASYYNGARVEIDDLDISFIGLELGWKRLQVTNTDNTMENIIETGPTRLKVAILPLLYSSVVIEEVSMKNIRTNTERSTDGAMTFPERDQEPGVMEQTAKKLTDRARQSAQTKLTNIKTNINTDSLVAAVDLQTPERIDSVRNQLAQQIGKLEEQIDTSDVGKQLTSLSQKIEAIKPGEIKSPKQARESIESLNKLRQQLQENKKQIRQLRTSVGSQLTSTTDLTRQVDNWISRDIRQAQNLAQLPDLSARNIGEILFGDKFVQTFTTYLGYAKQTGDILGFSDVEEDQRPSRSEGRNIKFSDKYNWPSFWVQLIGFSGTTPSGLNFSGDLNHLVSNQGKIGEPTSLTLSGKNSTGTQLELSGLFDYMSDTPGETFKVDYSNFPLESVNISNADLMPKQLTSGMGHLDAELKLRKKTLSSRIKFSIHEPVFEFSSRDNESRLESLVRNTIQNTKTVELKALMDGTEDDLNFKLNSNLDDEIAASLKATINDEVAQAKEKIRQEVIRRVDEKRDQLIGFVQQKEQLITSKVDNLASNVSKQEALIEDKTKELKKKAAGTLKNKFDFK